MMKLSYSTFAFATVIAAPVRAGPIFDMLFDTDAIIQGACDTALTGLGFNNSLSCDCDGDFGFFRGASANANCSLSPACSSENEGSILCSTAGTVDLSYSTPGVLAFLTGAGGFAGDVTACVTIDTGLPDIITNAGLAIPEVCVSAQPGPNFQLSTATCQATIGDETCGCAPCDTGLSVTVDCTEVNLLNFLPTGVPTFGLEVAGPKFECVGLDFEQVIGALPIANTTRSL